MSSQADVATYIARLETQVSKIHSRDFYADNVPRDPLGHAGQRRRIVLISRLL